jgi:ribosomal protein S18 acetylase RimI-like enzyme
MSRSAGLARRFASDVSPLAGLQNPSRQAFADLRTLVGPDDGVGLCTAEPIEVPSDWQVARTFTVEQMVCTELAGPAAGPQPALGPADVPEMLALTAATQPGPFLPGTIQMGRYYGVRTSDGRLIAMAGERLKLDAFTEISAVCTDPAFRGRGLAAAFVTFLVAQCLREGTIPFLHVKSDNVAIALYEKIGFRIRRSVQLTVLKPASRNG